MMHTSRKMSSFHSQLKYSINKCYLLMNRVMSTANSSSGFISLNDGANLYYEQAGVNSNKTLVCIPGALGSTRSDYSYQLDHLMKDFNVIAFDPRGYGKSLETKRNFSPKFYHQDASDAAEVMAKLGYKKYSVLGWSDGGISALILAAQQNECIEKLVVWGSNCFVAEEDKALIESVRDLDKWSEKMRAPLEKLYGKDGLRTLWSSWVNSYLAFGENPHGDICISEVKQISCPTLIVHGSLDAMVAPCHPDFLHKHIRNSSLHIMPKGKHNLHMRYYEEFNQLVTDFISEK